MVVGYICRHVRLDEECEQIASLDVLPLERTGALLAVLPHDFRLLLLQELHADPLHCCACVFHLPHSFARLHYGEHTSNTFHDCKRLDATYNSSEYREQILENFAKVEPRRGLEYLLKRGAELIWRLLSVKRVEVVIEP